MGTTQRISCATLILTLSSLVISTSAFGASNVGSSRDRSTGAPISRQSQPKCAIKVFTSDIISFRYSSCWTSRSYPDGGTFLTLVDVLSNEVTHSPCRTVTNPRGSETSCGWPLRHLQRSGVLIEWWFGGVPGWKLSEEKGSTLSVGGRPAHEEILHQACGSIGGNEQVAVFVSRPIVDNFLLMTACLRSPDDAFELHRIRAMLVSVSSVT